MAKVTWTLGALADLAAIRAYLKPLDPDAAETFYRRLFDLGESLSAFPERGRPASRGTREMTRMSPYIRRYRYCGGKVTILTIRHFARRPL